MNVKTGAVYEIRPDMLKQANHHWRVLDYEKYKHLKGAARNQERSIEAPKAEIHVPKKSQELKVVMTSKGKPFATENAAKAAMSRKGLSEHEWVVLPNGNDGFIISKV